MTLDIKLDQYRLIEEIGRGGFGTVYRAIDETLQVERAVKVLHPALVADPSFIERFREEARLVARLKHPHILSVYALGEYQGNFYLVMDYMPGGSLKEVLAEDGPLPFKRALEVLKQIASSLDYAHEQNLVHRDVKPGNILFDASGNAYLTDFGFAKSLAAADSSTTMSVTGGILGTPAYMAPETWDGRGWTPAADVYSLACVFYEMLVGRPLYDGETPPEIMRQHIIDGPQFPKKWPEGTPRRIVAVFEKALEARPGQRCTGAGVFAKDAENLLGFGSPKPPGELPWWQQRIAWAGFAGAAVILLLILVAIKVIPPLTPTPTLTASILSTVSPTDPTLTPRVEPTNTMTPIKIPTQANITSDRGLEILARGTILIGIRDNDMYPMSFVEAGDYKGFEIDLAREIVERLFGDRVKTGWMLLSAGQRLEYVEKGEVDFLIRNTTHTTSREAQVAFTSAYFWDGVRLLVRRSDGYSNLEDLEGKTIVALDEFYAAPVRDAAAAAGIDVKILVHSGVEDMFYKHIADAFATDWSAHGFYTYDYSTHQAIGGLLSSEPLAIAVSRDDREFRDEIDAVLLEIIQDGTWQTFYDRWFPEPPPWTIEEMLAAPPANR